MVEHVDPDVLALIALGEPADDATRAHLADCDRCRAETEELSAVVAHGRAVTPADALVAAPAAVWAGIRTELALAEDLEPDGTVPARRRLAGGGIAGAGAPGAEALGAPGADGPERHELSGAGRFGGGGASSGRARRAPWIAAAAAAGVVVGGAGGALWAGRETPPAEPAVIAEAALDPLPGWDATGAATVQENPDGTRVLVVTLDGGAGEDGFHEVWLIDREVTRLVSLGVLEGSEGRFTVPAGLDLTDFAVVDVSEEPFDGDPAHSGDSIIRGILDA
jgi:hypothetical protein